MRNFHLTGRFQRYDRGRKQNLERYGQEEPPAYPIEKISAQVHLIWTREDFNARQKVRKGEIKHGNKFTGIPLVIIM